MKDNFKYKKSLGQNFLNDNNIINKIGSSISPTEKDLIIEIGPGSGALTKILKKYNCKLFSFEIDERLREKLEVLEDENTKIIFKDFLTVDIKSFLEKYSYNNLYIIGNIPYYITSEIVKKIIYECPNACVVLMIQKEVADRFLAKPKTSNYGSITAFINYNYNVTKVCDVGKNCFIPVPKVDSSVVKFEKHNKYKVNNELEFYSFIKKLFLLKRKTLKNNLSASDFTKIENYLIDNNISLTCRSEELSIENIIDIYNILHN